MSKRIKFTWDGKWTDLQKLYNQRFPFSHITDLTTENKAQIINALTLHLTINKTINPIIEIKEHGDTDS